MWRRPDPGPCPICGVAHCGCTPQTGPIVVAQLPARDARSPEVETVALVGAVDTTAAADQTLGDGSDGRPFSTATYRGKNKKRK